MAFDNIHLEKGMYHEAGRSFTQVLEQLDPSEGYRGTPLENTDAFQRQLKRFGIRVKGAGSDTVEKFFSTFESAVLFPEFLARAVRQGMDEANILPAITATVTRIDAMDYRMQKAPWIIVFNGLALFLVVTVFQLFGDRLSEFVHKKEARTEN